MVPLESCPNLLSYQTILMTPPLASMLEKKCWPVMTSLTRVGVVQVFPPSVDLANMTLLSEANWGIVKVRKELPGKLRGSSVTPKVLCVVNVWPPSIDMLMNIDACGKPLLRLETNTLPFGSTVIPVSKPPGLIAMGSDHVSPPSLELTRVAPCGP